MSTHAPHTRQRPGRRLAPAVTLPRLAEKKRLGEPIVMVTAYDYPSARLAEAAGVDLVLVGDSGRDDRARLPSTVPVELDELLVLAARRAPRPAHAVARRRPALRLLRGLRRAGRRAPRCASSRRRAATPSSSRAAARRRSRAPARSSRAGIPVMGHVGLTPQTSTALGGYKAQGRTAERAPRGRARGARAPGGRLLLDRLRGDPRRRSPRRSCRRWRSRSSASAPARRPTARCSSSTTCSASARASARVRQALRRPPATRWPRRRGLRRRRRARARFPAPEHGYSIAPEELERFRARLRDARSPPTAARRTDR